jgi:hypothetical protein
MRRSDTHRFSIRRGTALGFAWTLLAVGLVAALFSIAAAETAARPEADGLAHVTLIGDSIATALPGNVTAVQILRQGVDLDLEVAPCRRLVTPSCPPNPPTVMELIQRRGAALGPTVVMVLGYNEFEDQYAGAIEKTLDALERVGVERVFWLTLRAARHPYLNMNDDLRAAAARHPRLSVVDWNLYSRSHPDWFQGDGIHLLAEGSQAMATLIRTKLLDAGVALPPVDVKTELLPVARRGRPYTARLDGSGGRRPYAWSLSGRLPRGLHLRPSGVFWGTTRALPGRYPFTVRATDAVGQIATRELVLRLR